MPRQKSIPSRCVSDKRYLDSAVVDILTEIGRWNLVKETEHFTNDYHVAQLLLDCYDFISSGALIWADKTPPQTNEGALLLKQKTTRGQKTLRELRSLMLKLSKVEIEKQQKKVGTNKDRVEVMTEEKNEIHEERRKETETEELVDEEQKVEMEQMEKEKPDCDERITSSSDEEEFIDISFDYGMLPDEDGEPIEMQSESPRKRQRSNSETSAGIQQEEWLDKRTLPPIKNLPPKQMSIIDVTMPLHSSPQVNKKQIPNETNPQGLLTAQPSKISGKVSQIVYECKECLKRFESEESVEKFKEHYRTHLTPEQVSMEIRLGKVANILWKCLTCGLVVTNVYNHRKTHYSSFKKPRPCDICGKVLGSERSLRTHKAIHIAKITGTSHRCEVCGKSYQRLVLLKEHVKRHTTERPFVCMICGKGFIRNSDLNRHMTTHDKVKSVKCTHCDKGFSSQELLRSHLLTHTAEKKFKCEICLKTFNHRQGLVYHNKSGRCAPL